MANSLTFSHLCLAVGSPASNLSGNRGLLPFYSRKQGLPSSNRRANFKIRAAKLPAGVELPKEEPKFEPPFAGFTRTAETWNSRAGMIGLVSVFIIELILNKGILQLIGLEVGKGLDLPL